MWTSLSDSIPGISKADGPLSWGLGTVFPLKPGEGMKVGGVLPLATAGQLHWVLARKCSGAAILDFTSPARLSYSMVAGWKHRLIRVSSINGGISRILKAPLFTSLRYLSDWLSGCFKIKSIMKNLFHFSLVFVIVALASGCEKEPPLISYEEVYVSPVYTQFEFRDTSRVDFVLQEYRLGSYLEDETPRYSWDTWDKVTSRGPAILVDIMQQGPWSTATLFGMEFWAQPAVEKPWTAAHLKNMFEPGRVFLFGKGAGRVDVSFAHEGRITHVDQRSRASYLEEPEGQLQIVSTEDYSYLHPIEGQVEGLLVHCSFEGKLGLYDPALTPVTEHFKTDAALTLKNGTAAFLVAYE